MTIHKSKGLEFDVVLLPGLANGTRPNTAGLLMWHQRLNSAGETDLIMAPLTAKGQEKHPTQHYLIAEDSKKTGFEACRLLYVACTRAKQKLYLFADLSTSKKDEAINKPGIRLCFTASGMPFSCNSSAMSRLPPSRIIKKPRNRRPLFAYRKTGKPPRYPKVSYWNLTFPAINTIRIRKHRPSACHHRWPVM